VSYGDRDAVRGAIATLAGADMTRSFDVAMRPAKPFTFGVLNDTGVPVFALPGNPVSAMVAYEVFARPALLRLAGHTMVDRPHFGAVADERIDRRRDGKVHYVRVIATLDTHGHLHVRSGGGQNPHMLHVLAGSNALAVLPDGDGVAPGDEVRVLLIDADELNLAD
jgi:molybdopterin biosynthesis enzyme